MYMQGLNPNYVVKKEENISKCDFWQRDESGKIVAPIHGEDSLTATLLVCDLKMVPVPVTHAFLHTACVCEGMMGAD